MNYYDLLQKHANVSMAVCTALTHISSFFETLSNLGFGFFLIDTVNIKRGKHCLEWLLLQIYNVYNYFSVLDFEPEPEEREKLQELRINKIESLRERARELTRFLRDSACLVKY